MSHKFSGKYSKSIKWALAAIPSVLLFLFLISSSILDHREKIAFIRSVELLDNYKGMAEMQTMFNQKKSVWETEMDSLKRLYLKEKASLESNFSQLSETEKNSARQVFLGKQEKIEARLFAIEEKIEDEDEKMMQSVLNQVNSFIEKYAKEHDIELVLGTTYSGNILYGEDYLDITDEVSKELNLYYLNGATK